MSSFICLNKLLLLKQKLQACWTILFRFGYNISLSLSDSFIESKKATKDDGEFELSTEGTNYLKSQWYYHTNRTISEIYILEEIFATLEGGCPFNAMEISVIKQGVISIQTWIDIWQMLLHIDCSSAFKYALYLGYEGTFEGFADEIDRESWNIFGSKKRLAYRCALIERLPIVLEKIVGPAREAGTRCATFSLPEEESPTMVLCEIPVEAKKEDMTIYDICVLVHDGSRESYNFIKAIRGKLPENVPRAIIEISLGANAMIPLIPSTEIIKFFGLLPEVIAKITLPADNIDSAIKIFLNIFKKPYFLAITDIGS